MAEKQDKAVVVYKLAVSTTTRCANRIVNELMTAGVSAIVGYESEQDMAKILTVTMPAGTTIETWLAIGVVIGAVESSTR